MSAFADLGELVNRLTGGNSGTPELLTFWKDGRVGGAAAATPVAARWTSLWQYEGQPAHGAAPGAVAAPTNATNGSLFQTDPGGGREKFLTGGVMHTNTLGTVMLYDRLLHISGLNGTTTPGAQTVGGTLTRYTNGLGNQIWIEIYTQIGISSTTITASYTDQDGNGATTPTAAIGNTGLREAQRMIPLQLAAGDRGVQAVASVTLAGSTGTAGDFGVTVVHPLGYWPIVGTGVGCFVDYITGLPALPEIETDACLALAFLPNTTTVPTFWGALQMVER